MSIRIMSQCWDATLSTPAHKLVLLRLSDHANDHGLAYPGAIGIGKVCGLKERRVREILGDLRTWGFVSVHAPEDPIAKKPITTVS